MLMTMFKLSLPSASSSPVRDPRKPEQDIDASDSPGRLRKVVFCEKGMPATASSFVAMM
jgi:hypothetical protein